VTVGDARTVRACPHADKASATAGALAATGRRPRRRTGVDRKGGAPGHARSAFTQSTRGAPHYEGWCSDRFSRRIAPDTSTVRRTAPAWRSS